MHLSAERIAIADRAVRQTVEQTGVAWAALPRWDTGDPGQVLVRGDVTRTHDAPVDAAPFASAALEVETLYVPFRITLAQATSSTPDALLAAVAPRAAQLAGQIDTLVLGVLVAGRDGAPREQPSPEPSGESTALLDRLLDGRERVEDAGYRASSCLIAGNVFHRALNRQVDRVVVADLLAAANVNSVYRSAGLEGGIALLLGRRQQIAHGGAGSATPGEEPVDLAVAVPPSLEVVGESAGGEIELAVRVRFATRVKDALGVVVLSHS